MAVLSSSSSSISTNRIRASLVSLLLLVSSGMLTGCGGVGKTSTPQQPSYPFAPPVPITWSPQTSPLPAPPAQEPPPAGSNDFPLIVSSPTDGSSATSPLTVTASATPKNPIFFMRVYIDQLAVYFTFTNSINAQIWTTPGKHTVEVMAEDNQGYISVTLLQVNVTSQQQQTMISSIQNMPGWQSCSATFPPGSGRANLFPQIRGFTWCGSWKELEIRCTT